MKSMMKFGLAAAVSLVALEASAGGFGVREQSATSQGASFAGAATGAAGMSGMYWNPAVITQFPGFYTEKHLSTILGYSKLTPTTGSGPLVANRGDSGNLGVPAIVPATYFSYQFNDQLFLGLSVNSPYGLKTKAEYNWAGQIYGRSSKAKNILVTPTLAYKVNDWLSLGAGIQVGYFDVTLKGATSYTTNASNAMLSGDAFGAGYTLGATLTPAAGTEIGLGFRSSIHYSLEGDLQTLAGKTPIRAKVNLPETITLGLRQQFGKDFTFLAGFEWSNWSRVGLAAIRHAATDTYISKLSFDYKDGWMASIGGEYRVNNNLTMRAGLAYEESPITDKTRSVRIPDNDRIWASLGATYKWSDQTSFDLAYSHIFVKDPKVNIIAGHHEYQNAFVGLVANGKSHVDIISFSLKHYFNAPPKPVSKAVVTKG